MKNTKVISRNKLYATMFIIMILVIMLCISCSGIIDAKANAETTTAIFETKVYSNINIDDDFDDSYVLVVMDKFSSGFNKSHTNLFSKLPFLKAITDLTKLTGDITEKTYLNQESFRQILKIDLKEPSKQNVLNLINKVQKLNGVLWSGVGSPYYPVESNETPVAMSGNRYQEQWALHGDFGINAVDAWNYSTGSRSVRVGIIDSGIADHDDLRDSVIAGWNFVDKNDDTSDQYGHGTAIAGVIGATGSAKNGIMGINRSVEIVPLKVISTEYDYSVHNKFSRDVPFDPLAIIEAISWSINNNVDILNMSFGNNDNNESLKSAMNNYKGLIICAAGNDLADNDTRDFYPANYSQGETFSSRVISVSAIDSAGRIKTSFGKKTVSLFAPGIKIITTCSPNGVDFNNDPSGYKEDDGSSIAAPHVTGVAALLYARYYSHKNQLYIGYQDYIGNQIPEKIKSTILNNVKCTDYYIFQACCSAGGILDAAAALKNCEPIPTIMGGYGYDDGWYYWRGVVDLESEKPKAITYNADGELIVRNPTNLNFRMGTVNAFNAVSEITIDMIFILRNSANEIVYIEKTRERFYHTLTVGLFSNSKNRSCNFTVYESELVNKETYTLSWRCYSTRKDKICDYTKTFSFTVDYDYMKE